MRPTLILLLLASSLALQGQEQTKHAVNAASNTMDGCLVFFAHEYRIIDAAGKSVELQNQANKLIHYVGQQVEITGQPGIKTVGTTVDSLASSADEVPVFNVTGVRSTGRACASDSNK